MVTDYKTSPRRPLAGLHLQTTITLVINATSSARFAGDFHAHLPSAPVSIPITTCAQTYGTGSVRISMSTIETLVRATSLRMPDSQREAIPL